MDRLTIDELLDDEVQLLTLPHIVIELIGMLDDPETDMASITNLVATDAVLSAKVLRIINSAYYALPFSVSSISQAVGLVGLKTLRELVIATRVADTFKGFSGDLLDVRSFWENSFVSAGIAQEFAATLGLEEERMFAVALLHHLGMMVMLQRMPQQMKAIIGRAKADVHELYRQEMESLGYSHTDVTARLMGSWQLPEFFSEVCQYQHEFYRAPQHPTEAAILHLADAMAQSISPLMYLQGVEQEADLAVFDYITLPAERLQSMAEQAMQERDKAGILLQ